MRIHGRLDGILGQACGRQIASKELLPRQIFECYVLATLSIYVVVRPVITLTGCMLWALGDVPRWDVRFLF
jgi:hypothetical protein